MNTQTNNSMLSIMGGEKASTILEVNAMLPNAPLGKRHNPIPYSHSIEFLKASLNKFNFNVTGENYVMAAGGQRLFGLMQLESFTEDYSTLLAFNRSYDQSVAFNIAAADGTWICSNLEIHGEFTVKTKQTTFIYERIEAKIDEIVGKLPQIIIDRQQVVKSYQDTQLTIRQGDAAITEMLRQKIITTNQIGRLVKEWDAPIHPEHAQHNIGDRRSLSQLAAAVTESQKPLNGRSVIPAAMERTPKMTEFFKTIVTGINNNK